MRRIQNRGFSGSLSTIYKFKKSTDAVPVTARSLSQSRKWTLRAAYWLKEDFFNIWTAQTQSQALDLYQAWQKRLPTELEPAFHPLLSAIENWRAESRGKVVP